MVTVIAAASFIFTLPNPVSGHIPLMSNVTQLTLNPSEIDLVMFSGTKAAAFYQSKCSDIEIERLTLNYSGSAYVTEQQYVKQEFYFIQDSSLHFEFSVPLMQNDSGCVVKVHTFRSNYQLVTNRQDNEAISYCLLHNSSVNFTLSAVEQEQYYFVALESFVNTSITYTVAGDLLRYITTSLPRTRCATNCSISLSDYPGGEDVCIIAAVKETNEPVYYNYTTQLSRHWKIYEAVYWLV